jgi:peptide/nickel transport system substrate-binding protein
MHDRTRRERDLAMLARAAFEGSLDRRAFFHRAAAVGLSVPAATAMFRTYRAAAFQTTPSASNPITVTIGGTPIAVGLEPIANATKGGTFKFARASDSDNLDPVTNDGNVNIWIFTNIYDTLVRVTPDGANLEPSLAEKWDISKDGKTYTFHLRPGVKFSDGTPMKASDVKWSFERAANDPEQHWTFTLTALKRDSKGNVQGISTPDDQTVVVELSQPWAPFLADVAMFNMAVISEAFAKDDPKKLTDQCMGTGPFALKEWAKGDHITLVKNANYWEEDLPLLDEIVVSIVADDNARILQLQGGEIDGLDSPPFSRVDELKSDPNLKIWQFPSTYTAYATLNTTKEPLDDPNVRVALNYGVDRDTLIQVVLFGLGIPATSFMPKGALYWDPDLTGFPYDVNKAKELLAKSKVPNGFPLELQTLAGNADQDTLGSALKDMWSKIGVDVTLTPVEFSVSQDNYRKGNFQAQLTSWTNDIIDPDELVAYAILPSGSNMFGTHWSDAEAQKLAKEGEEELDPDKRREIYYRIQEIFNQQSPMVILYHQPYLAATTAKVHNFLQPPTGQWVWKQTWVEQ